MLHNLLDLRALVELVANNVVHVDDLEQFDGDVVLVAIYSMRKLEKKYMLAKWHLRSSCRFHHDRGADAHGRNGQVRPDEPFRASVDRIEAHELAVLVRDALEDLHHTQGVEVIHGLAQVVLHVNTGFDGRLFYFIIFIKL